jgi:hypothetical protein
MLGALTVTGVSAAHPQGTALLRRLLRLPR